MKAVVTGRMPLTVRATAIRLAMAVAICACRTSATTVNVPASDATPPEVVLDVYGVPAARNSGQSVEPVTAVGGQQRSVNIPSLTELTAIARGSDADGGMWFLQIGFGGTINCPGSVAHPGFADIEVAPGFPSRSGWQPGAPLPPGFPTAAPVSLTNTITVVRSLTNCSATGMITATAVNATGGSSQQAKVTFQASP